jgi:hypothetical protein
MPNVVYRDDEAVLEKLEYSPRRRLVALQLALFLGALGGHRWYLGKPKTALLQALTCGGAGIWWLYDVYRLAVQDVFDGDGRLLSPAPLGNPTEKEHAQIAEQVLADHSTDERASIGTDEALSREIEQLEPEEQTSQS